MMIVVALCVEASSLRAADDSIDFTRQIQPILAKRCYACHGADKAEGGISFADKERAFGEADSGEHAVVPGDVAASHMLARVTATDESERMPPEGDAVPAEEVALLTRWIEQGAKWSDHWAFEPVANVEPPSVDDPAWSHNPIDRFIYAEIARRGLTPNEVAEPLVLVRRAYYDLHGLPPSREQIEAFEAASQSDDQALAKLVDELLASPHYGERWGRHWLDLVRYAETNSFERDGDKPNAWKYRDYVIRSFNDDKPYDQFVREQLAGDVLPKPTPESITATGFYRLGIWDDEPADPVQAVADEMDDIVTTVGQVFLGLTVNCARCHDHKIDPIPQTEYFGMLAFLGDVTPYGTRGDQTGNNQRDCTSDEQRQRFSDLTAAKERVVKQSIEIEQAGIVKMEAPDQRATEGPPEERKKVLDAKLQKHLDADEWQQYQNLQAELAEIESQLKSLPPREMVLALARIHATPPPTRVHLRGNPNVLGDVVEPHFMSIFKTPAPALLAGGSVETPLPRRLVLADWITDEQNMLTARVMVNRVWQYHFGRGLVASSNNFGKLGTPPTHPALLDWLARRLIADGWRLKPLHRLIMSSRAYQLSSQASETSVAKDPGNDAFWRFNPRRLSAEELRDSILVATGSLNRKVYGPSMYPTLSREVLQKQSIPGKGWGKSSPEEQNRRSVYIFVKRSLLVPMLEAFDFPEPDRPCEARFSTLQPGQALSLLNSDAIHEQAARLFTSVGGQQPDDGEFAQRAISAVLMREATADELAAGTQLISDLQKHEGCTHETARRLYCLTLFNWNEFVFVD
jgi:mono/diheme cytochrome c family protein